MIPALSPETVASLFDARNCPPAEETFSREVRARVRVCHGRIKVTLTSGLTGASLACSLDTETVDQIIEALQAARYITAGEPPDRRISDRRTAPADRRG